MREPRRGGILVERKAEMLISRWGYLRALPNGPFPRYVRSVRVFECSTSVPRLRASTRRKSFRIALPSPPSSDNVPNVYFTAMDISRQRAYSTYFQILLLFSSSNRICQLSLTKSRSRHGSRMDGGHPLLGVGNTFPSLAEVHEFFVFHLSSLPSPPPLSLFLCDRPTTRSRDIL